VWPLFVVFRAPVLDDQPRLSNRNQCPAVQATIAKDPVERLVVAVLPRASRHDEVRVGGSVFDPLLDASRYELVIPGMIRVKRAIHKRSINKRSINNSRAVPLAAPLAQLLRHLQPPLASGSSEDAHGPTQRLLHEAARRSCDSQSADTVTKDHEPDESTSLLRYGLTGNSPTRRTSTS
jgi:hypothetical protein